MNDRRRGGLQPAQTWIPAWLAAVIVVAAIGSAPVHQRVSAQTAVDLPARAPFHEWLASLRAEALAAGITEATVDAALATITEPNPVVVARNRAQPEQVRTLDGYISQWLTARTTTTATKMATEHRPLLNRVAKAYGPPPPILLAVWGLESNFGRFTGTYPTVPALATLAYDPRRSRLFRTELIEALRILDRGHIPLADMKGSWAGAMGQPQFMPSSYLKHAVDFDEDGRADIWSSAADVFASIGNYLKAAGWIEGERWGREVRMTRAGLDEIERSVPMRARGCAAIREMTEARPLAAWAALGVRLPSGGRLPDSDLEASLVRGQARHFLVYRNYFAILDYNCSNAYAISVGLLSDRLWN